MNVRRILAPVDFSDTTDAGLSPAVSLATEYGAELVLLHVLNFPYPQLDHAMPSFDLDAYYDEMQASAINGLAGLVDDHTRDYAPVRTMVERGVAYHEIVRVAQDERVDLVVLPTHGRTGLAHLLFGSTAEKVARLAPCPVLTVCPKEAPHAFRPERIVVATDFSPTADLALAEATALALRYGAEVTLIHVVTMWDSDPGNPAWRFPSVPQEFSDSIVEASRKQLDERCQPEGPVPVHSVLLRGFDPAREMVAAAESADADLLVLGTHGHRGLARVLLGSVAEKVVRTFAGPVLIVRPAA